MRITGLRRHRNVKGNSQCQLEEAWQWMINNFPFVGYIKEARKSAYVELPRVAWQTLGGSGRILDFGAGPCDKTALFARMNLQVVAYDDLQDPWHIMGDNRAKILDFAERAGIEYQLPIDEASERFPFEGDKFDMLMLHHVLEHLHDSPRHLLNRLLSVVKDRGWLFVTVPNAANLRKRIFLAVGKTNYQSYAAYYWYPGPWRGHVREYVRDDLRRLAQYLGLEIVELRSYNHFWHAVPRIARWPFRVIGRLVPGFRDSWLLLARKPAGWRPRFELSKAELAEVLRPTEFYDYGAELGESTQGGQLIS